MRSTKRVFDVSGLACMRGGRLLFQNLSFHFSEGDVLHLSGPNGAGKTSLLRILSGALPPIAGKISWQGEDFLGKGLEVHARRYAFLPSDDKSLKSVETAEESLLFWAGIFGVADAEKKCRAALKKMDMQKLKDTAVKYLSAGQKRRLGLARVFLKEAPLWLLDEPLNGLDIKSYDLFMEALNEHTASGGMAAIASHYAITPPEKGHLRRVDVGCA